MSLHSRSPLASLAPALIINVAHLVGANAAELNYEVEGRILVQLTFYMQDHVTTKLFITTFHFSGRFPHSLHDANRDAYMGLNNALFMPNIYYGLKDGSISGLESYIRLLLSYSGWSLFCMMHILCPSYAFLIMKILLSY